MRTLSYLTEMIRYPSVSSESNVAVTEHVESWLVELGFEVERVDYSDDNGVRKASVLGRKGPMGQKPGDGLAYFGHTDVVPVNSWSFPEAGPWDWWSKPQLDATIAFVNANFGTEFDANELHSNGLLTNPDMSPEKARRYIDTIMAYYIPRACVAFEFQECINALGLVDVEEVLDASQVGLVMGPNPASESVFLQTHADYPMKDIRLFTSQGLLVKSHLGIKDNSYMLHRGDMPPGLYIAIVQFEEGMVIRKIVFD